MVNRRTGSDKFSVVDYINSENHNQVRLTATSAAYDADGKPVYLAVLGELYSHGFTQDQNGVLAMEKAGVYPIYVPVSPANRPLVRRMISRYFSEEEKDVGADILLPLPVHQPEKMFIHYGYLKSILWKCFSMIF